MFEVPVFGRNGVPYGPTGTQLRLSCVKWNFESLRGCSFVTETATCSWDPFSDLQRSIKVLIKLSTSNGTAGGVPHDVVRKQGQRVNWRSFSKGCWFSVGKTKMDWRAALLWCLLEVLVSLVWLNRSPTERNIIFGGVLGDLISQTNEKEIRPMPKWWFGCGSKPLKIS